MHRLWDTDMIERVSKEEDFWLTALSALDMQGNRQDAMKGTVEEWATESLMAARQALPGAQDWQTADARPKAW